ncbi:hypothetical protein HOY82DRAFT_614658 [Tuber indicum]|nr:hypothetical protein HOY82DRAFT_614658 [Tuber indicum]
MSSLNLEFQSTTNAEVIPPLVVNPSTIRSRKWRERVQAKRLQEDNLHNEIQESTSSAILDIKKITSPRSMSKLRSLSGPYLQQHYNVLCFLKLQVFQEKQALARPDLHLLRSRKILTRQVVDGSQSGNRVMRRLMRDEVSWVQFRRIEATRRGQYQKVECLLNDEDILLAVLAYIAKSDENIDSYRKAQVINQSWIEAEDLVIGPGGRRNIQQIEKSITGRTGSRWLSKLGFKWKEEVFIPFLKALSSRLMLWDKDLNPKPTEELVTGAEQPVIIVTQDECTFNSNDGKRFIWTLDDHNPIRKKGRGQGLHVSELLTLIGRLGGGSAYEILKCGGDTWWDREKLQDQILKKAIPAFEQEFPRCQALFMFDNAKSHMKFADDDLRVVKMNLDDGEKNAKPMHATFVTNPQYPGGGWLQSMVTADGTLKGLKTVLTERKLWPDNGSRFLTQCRIKKASGKTKPNL